jgi:outer membrane lipoprotein-sorting protein
MNNTAKRNSHLTFYVILSLLMMIFTLSFSLPGDDATAIVKKADQKLKGKTAYAEMTIQIIRPTWKREMSIKSWSKGDDYALILVTAPAKDKGTVSLKREKEVWSWMPTIERTIKLPPSMMTQSWMGTDFTNDDLVKQSSIVEDYDHDLGVDSTIEGRSCYKIIMTPKPEAAVVWGKVILFIDKKEYIEMRAEYYDEDGALINIMTGSAIKMLGGKLLPSVMEMIPVEKPGQKTVLIYNSLKFDDPIDDNFFTIQNIKSVQ